MSEHRKLEKLYGIDFPGGNQMEGEAWVRWLERQFRAQEHSMQAKKLNASLHRNFRMNRQWLTTRDGRKWKSAGDLGGKPRPTLNLFGPALDFRLGVVEDQKPGFNALPLPSQSTSSYEVAEAQQSLAEYYYNRDRYWNLFRAARASAQTDGMCLVHVYVEDNAGEVREDVRLIGSAQPEFEKFKAAGYEVNDKGFVVVPIGEAGEPLPPGTTSRIFKTGDISSRLVYAHEVLVDPEAKSVNGQDAANWIIVRRLRDLETARLLCNDPELEADGSRLSSTYSDANIWGVEDATLWRNNTPPWPTKKQAEKEGIWDYTIYIRPHPDTFPDGLCRRVIGHKMASEEYQKDSLSGGLLPFARVTDGTSDDDFWPRPICADWVTDQIQINGLLLQMMQQAQHYGGTRVMALNGTMLQESFNDIMGSVLLYEGLKPDIIPAQSSSVDLKEMLSFLIQKFEDKTSWNQLSRGQVQGQAGGGMQDVSGRALLGARDLLERPFGPVVAAAAEGVSEWAQLVVAHAKDLFSTDRLIPLMGDRPDLARKLKGSDLGPYPVVYVDPETFMPMPRSLRHQMLQQLAESGWITPENFIRRAPYADIRNVHYGDRAQWDRAQWMNLQLEERWEEFLELDPEMLYGFGATPIFYSDSPPVHKQALDELIADDKKPWQVRMLASQRYAIYDELDRAKQQPLMTDPQTGQQIGTAMPPEVIGVPKDLQPAPAPSPEEMAGAGGGMEALIGSSPNPAMSGAGVPMASQDTAAPLGSNPTEQLLME